MSEALHALAYILVTLLAFGCVAYLASIDPGAWHGYAAAGALLFARATLRAHLRSTRLDALRAKIRAAGSRDEQG